MGNGIAHVFSLFENNIILVDISSNILNNAISIINKNLKRQFSKGIISKKQISIALKNITVNTDMNSLENCDFIKNIGIALINCGGFINHNVEKTLRMIVTF